MILIIIKILFFFWICFLAILPIYFIGKITMKIFIFLKKINQILFNKNKRKKIKYKRNSYYLFFSVSSFKSSSQTNKIYRKKRRTHTVSIRKINARPK